MSSLAARWQYRHGIKGLNGVAQEFDPLYGGGYEDPTYYDYGSGYEVPAYAFPEYAYTPDLSYGVPTYDPAFSDIGLAAPSTVIGLPDGSSVDLTGAQSLYDPASSQSYVLAPDGTKIYDDGTVLKPGGDIMTPGGTLVHADGSLTLATGEFVPGSTPTFDGLSVANQLSSWLKVGGDLATGATSLLSKLGIIEPRRQTAVTTRAGWVSPTQYRTATGAVVAPTKLANGLYQLPDGSTIGAPPAKTTGTTLLLVGGAAAAAFVVFRGRKAA